MGKEQAGLANPAAEFNAWMERNGLSLGAAAKALGITRRTIVYNHGGQKPIPIYIKLACIDPAPATRGLKSGIISLKVFTEERFRSAAAKGFSFYRHVEREGVTV